MSPLAITAIVGALLLLIARITGNSESITHRAYGKRYSGAPGADVENHPDGS